MYHRALNMRAAANAMDAITHAIVDFVITYSPMTWSSQV
jgi:hypothetical protein